MMQCYPKINSSDWKQPEKQDLSTAADGTVKTILYP